MPGGRPSKLTEDLIERVRKHLLNGNFRGPSCSAEGIPPTTFKRWMRLGECSDSGLYADFRAMVLASEQAAETEAVATVYTAGALDPKHLQWWLERRHAARWAHHWKLIEAEIRARLKRIEENLGTPSPAASD